MFNIILVLQSLLLVEVVFRLLERLCYNSNMTKITSVMLGEIEKVALKEGLLFVVLFGSQTNGQAKQESDIDLAVMVKGKPDYRLFSRLFKNFSEIFKTDKIDVRFLNGADPLFRRQVTQKGKLLYGNKHQYNLFKAYAYRSFADDGKKYFPYLDKILKRNQKELGVAL